MIDEGTRGMVVIIHSTTEINQHMYHSQERVRHATLLVEDNVDEIFNKVCKKGIREKEDIYVRVVVGSY